MKLLLLQTDIRWLAPDENRLRIEKLIASASRVASGGASGGAAVSLWAASGVDLIVLPEMFTTGFVVSPAGVAETNGGVETLTWMLSMAARTGAAVAGSVAVEEAGRFYNRLFFVRPDGSYSWYDKRHLFSFAGEDHRYTAGHERVVVEWRGWRILLQTCYDLRFPVFSRNRGDYDMVLYAASWPTARQAVWDILLRARALENVCYVAGVNRTGSDPAAKYSGGTALVNFRGEVVSGAAENAPEEQAISGRGAGEVVSGAEQAIAGRGAGDPLSEADVDAPVDRSRAILCEADLDSLRAFREKFPALADGDDFRLT
jgi:predicted amidohydrolase